MSVWACVHAQHVQHAHSCTQINPQTGDTGFILPQGRTNFLSCPQNGLSWIYQRTSLNGGGPATILPCISGKRITPSWVNILLEVPTWQSNASQIHLFINPLVVLLFLVPFDVFSKIFSKFYSISLLSPSFHNIKAIDTSVLTVPSVQASKTRTFLPSLFETLCETDCSESSVMSCF